MVPSKYDCIIDGHGYIFWNGLMQSLPFRNQRAAYSHTPTFVERSNTSGDYGDNQQDFWLTATQRDWSLGEQQKYFHSTDASSVRQYWVGSNVDVSTDGQVMLARQFTSLTFAAAVRAASRDTQTQKIVTASSTNLYTVDFDGTITDHGAHGLGNAPSKFGIANDGLHNYMTTLAASTVGVRKWTGSAFSTFSASAADALEYLNNTLYGYRGNAIGDLVKWDTSGTLTSIFTWKTSDGTGYTGGASILAALKAFGSKLLILFPYAQHSSELWQYDGTNTNVAAVFPDNFVASDIDVLYDVAYIVGSFERAVSTSTFVHKPALFFYDGSTLELVWKAAAYGTTATSSALNGPHPALGVNDGRLIFTDDTTSNFLAYDPALGSVETIGSYSAGGTDARIAATGDLLVHTRNQTGGYYYPHTTSYASSGSITTSQIDFESSLNKLFRGVKVEFDAAADGDGGTVDIAYRVGDLNGAYTTLQTGAVSGTEYVLSNVTGQRISVKVTLNKSTSTSGPVLKKIAVRAAPVQQTFRWRQFVLDLGGRFDVDVPNPVPLRDGTPSTLTGAQLAANLEASITSGTPIQVTDRYGTYTMVFQQGPGVTEIDEVRPGESVAQVTLREV